jgi:hypothetical protein
MQLLDSSTILGAHMDLQIILQIVAGALISILFVMWMEYIRQPHLRITIPQPADNTYGANFPAQRARFLRLAISNDNLPFFLRWLLRVPAQKCHGSIQFHHLDGQNVFGRAMQIRWIRSPEPVPIQANFGGQRLAIFDPVRLTPELNWDIYPGMEELFDVAARFDADVDCFGWSNESYFSDPIWRNPNWRVPPGRYLIKVEVFSSGKRCEGLFRLINDVQIGDFRLEPAQRDDTMI